jgi:predicted nucleic acid-binding protein
VTRIVLLDTGVLGLLVHPHLSAEIQDCRHWLETLLSGGEMIVLPEIADYELRRKLLHIDSRASLQRLDAIPTRVTYLPITTATWRKAAELWASARRQGRIAAGDQALDGDVILAAQAALLDAPDTSVLIATKNVRHLAPLADARLWTAI